MYVENLCMGRICAHREFVCREFVHTENLCMQRICAHREFLVSCTHARIEFHMHSKYVRANLHVHSKEKIFVK